VVETDRRHPLESWPTYEQYTGPLGAGTLTDIIGVHYGPGIESSERNGWGQWHRANGTGVGMDRTSHGHGFIAQYSPAVAAKYESLASTPDDLLLFFHHVPYTYKLRSGRTVIQHIYDSHFEGAQNVAGFVERWRRLDRFHRSRAARRRVGEARISGWARDRVARRGDQLVRVDLRHP
jgi:alpha-glucuronidase